MVPLVSEEIPTPLIPTTTAGRTSLLSVDGAAIKRGTPSTTEVGVPLKEGVATALVTGTLVIEIGIITTLLLG